MFGGAGCAFTRASSVSASARRCTIAGELRNAPPVIASTRLATSHSSFAT